MHGTLSIETLLCASVLHPFIGHRYINGILKPHDCFIQEDKILKFPWNSRTCLARLQVWRPVLMSVVLVLQQQCYVLTPTCNCLSIRG